MSNLDWFDQVLRAGIFNSKDMVFEPLSHVDNLRGGNTVMLLNDRFVCDSNSNCPRVAILRKHKIESMPTLESILSWTYGRAFETLVKQLIDRSGIEGLTFKEEEECLVEWVDQQDNTIFTERPDILINYQNENIVIEVKSAQSDNVCLQVYHKLKPKLGALLQIAVGMDYHEAKRGYVVYGTMHWTNAYDRAIRKGVSIQPRFHSHYCTFDDDRTLLVNMQPTIVNMDAIEAGINLLVAYDRQGYLPTEKPIFMDIYGERFKYDYCKMYCHMSAICDEFQHQRKIVIKDFIDAVSMEVDIK